MGCPCTKEKSPGSAMLGVLEAGGSAASMLLEVVGEWDIGNENLEDIKDTSVVILGAMADLAANGAGLYAWALEDATEFYGDKPVTAHADWMSNVPDNVRIADMFIPGTHDTGAAVPYSAGGIQDGTFSRESLKQTGLGLAYKAALPWSQCQSWTIEEQLNSGIRAFDLRIAFEDGLGIYHGAAKFDISYHDCAKALADFLKHHPRECIFLRTKQVSKDDAWRGRPNPGDPPGTALVAPANGRQLEDDINLVNATYFQPGQFDSAAGKKYRFHKLLQNAVGGLFPTMGDLRGKVVYFPEEMAGILGAPGWNSRTDQQDVYKTDDIGYKWGKIEAHAKQSRQPDRYYINYISCSGQILGLKKMEDMLPSAPALTASKLNKKLFDSNLDGFKGSFYMMDFPGTGLVKKIIEKNEKSSPWAEYKK